MALLLLGLHSALPSAAPPPWPPAVHMTGTLNGTTSIAGISVGPISGPFDIWSSCDSRQPTRGKMKQTGATTAYGVTVLNTTIVQDCTPSADAVGTIYENVA
jgi:hypothetical protein